MLLSIGELASALGVSVVTLRRWDTAGKLAPYPLTVGGHRRYRFSETLAALGGVDPLLKEDQSNKRLVLGYTRESFFDQKEDLVRQKERIGAHLINTPNSLVLTGFGSGLNFKKHGLTKLLALVMAGRVKKIVITHLNELISKMTVLATALTPRLTNTYCLVARS